MHELLKDVELRQKLTEALFKANVDENLRWVIQTLIDRLPPDPNGNYP